MGILPELEIKPHWHFRENLRYHGLLLATILCSRVRVVIVIVIMEGFIITWYLFLICKYISFLWLINGIVWNSSVNNIFYIYFICINVDIWKKKMEICNNNTRKLKKEMEIYNKNSKNSKIIYKE